MIESLGIRDFQSHENSILEFDPGVNVIVGQNDSGKTAIIRALYWVCFNRPTGDVFIRKGTSSTRVLAKLKNIPTIIREKGKSRNLYRIGLFKTDKQREFRAFGAGIPEDISDALNVGRINFQLQHDPPFLLSSSPGEVARHINDLANISVIDTATGNVARAIRELSGLIELLTEEKGELEEELKGYEYLEDLEKRVIELEAWDRERESLIRRRSKLVSQLKRIREAEERLADFQRECGAYRRIEPKVEELQNLHRKRDELRTQAETIAEILTKLARAEKDMNRAKRGIERLKTELRETMPDICPLCGQEVEK